FFFFSSRRRHTRSKRDWSSDVCSSDLIGRGYALQDQSPVYPGSAIHPAFGEGEVNGRIAIDPQRLLFTSETANVELSLDGLNIRSEERRVGKECRSGGATEE